MKVIDIASYQPYPAKALSNFAPYTFTVDSVICFSMEGFLQSLKFDNSRKQAEICLLIGKDAKYAGRSRNQLWKDKQILWWKGVVYDRHGRGYQDLLDRAFDALARVPKFQKALLDTGNAELKHTMGWNDSRETILTRDEFCNRLMKIRKELLDGPYHGPHGSQEH